MTRRARYLVAAAGAAAMLVAAAPAEGRTDARRLACYPSGSRTVTANEFVRVYTTPSHSPESQHSRRFVACSLERGLRRSLGGLDTGLFNTHLIANVRIAGRMVGYTRTAVGDSDQTDVIVRDATTGTALFSEPSTTGTQQIQVVSDLEITSTGSAVWIASYLTSDTQNRNYNGREVQAVEIGSGRHPVVRDSGLDIDAGSLALGRPNADGVSPIYWSKGGTVRSSTLR